MTRTGRAVGGSGVIAMAHRRTAQLSAMAHPGGLRETGQRLARRVYDWSGAVELEFPLLPEDVIDSTRVKWAVPSKDPVQGRPLTIARVMTPPSPGSGGHTTGFRMVRALEEAGHRCVIHLYDKHGSPVAYHSKVIRECWPALQARVVDIRDGVECADAYVATSWSTAHVLGAHGSKPGRRMYFVQDYEPFFYPRGSEFALADDTYRFGFRTIALGGMVAEMLRTNHGIRVDRIPFGTDLSMYRLTNTGPRDGVVFYAKPRVARRGYALAMAALREFNRSQPGQSIHLFGDAQVRPPFPAHVHGTVSPAALADMYNSSVAGLAISFTNISLVPYEMLACGAIPVMNSDPHARHELCNPTVRWAAATPSALAGELLAAVRHHDISGIARRAADSAIGLDWCRAQQEFVRIVEQETYRDAVVVPTPEAPYASEEAANG